MPGMLNGEELTVVDVYEAVGAYDAGQLSLEGLKNIENTACPNEGSCGGMFYCKYHGINFRSNWSCIAR